MPWQEWICGVSDEGVGILRVGRNLKYAPYDEECPGTFRHPGYYEKFIYVCSNVRHPVSSLYKLSILLKYEQSVNKV